MDESEEIVMEFLIFRFAIIIIIIIIIIEIASELADIGVATDTIHRLQDLESLEQLLS